MNIFSRLFKKIALGTQSEQSAIPERYPFTRWYTYGNHRYRYEGQRADVEFVSEATGKRVLLVDNNGFIRSFPGIVKGDWTKLLTTRKYLLPQVRFRSDFQKYDDEHYMMIWQIQPDGRYWADDDDFGIEDDVEIRLYALIDKDGKFEGPFRVYNAGNKPYFD